MQRKVRIGIDVGGTFTDAAVIDNETGLIIAKEKVPTTHYDEKGVAAGIMQIINKTMAEHNISPKDVTFIAHGTTQATNALLEGDVASVGIVGMGESKIAEKEMDVGNIELSTGKYLKVYYEYIPFKSVDEASINQAIDKLLQAGAEVIVASGAFSIENPEYENKVIEVAQQRGLYVTGGHEISELFGLKVRTRTAVINASLIPKMLETANMTERVVKEVGIDSELMIMRADGGVMSVQEVRKRPILTMLSGLAAGIAGALMYGKVTEGIFLEFGGTSVDISVIKDGKVMVKNASVGNYKTYVKSLDVRTLGVAGGTMIRIGKGGIIGVGPRSAHLANKAYECFTDKPLSDLAPVEIIQVSPLSGDPDDYAIARTKSGSEFAYTLAGAANALGHIPEDDYAYAPNHISLAFWDSLGSQFGKTGLQMAEDALDFASKKIWETIDALMKEYELDKSFLKLVGGGGSASVLTPYLAKKYNVEYSIVQNAPYISTIGVAMAMVREQIERSVVNPTAEDIKKIRMDILHKIIEMGALEETVEISVEVDSQKHVLIATATGATEFKQKDLFGTQLEESDIRVKVSESVSCNTADVDFIGGSGKFYGYVANKKTSGWLNLFKRNQKIFVVADNEGVVLYRRTNANLAISSKYQLVEKLKQLIDEYSTFSDAGQTIPNVYLFCKGRVFDYSGLLTVEQILPIINIDFHYIEQDEKVMMLVVK